MTRFYFLPEDYEPGSKTLDLARSLGLTDKQVSDQLDKCKDHQYKRPMMDPDRCFRNWLRNAIKFGDVVPSVQYNQRRPEEISEEQRKADAAKAWAEMNRLRGVKSQSAMTRKSSATSVKSPSWKPSSTCAASGTKRARRHGRYAGNVCRR